MMKKRLNNLRTYKLLLFIVFLSLSIISFGQAKEYIPIEFQDYVMNKSTKVEYKKVFPQTVEEMLNYKFAPCPDSISKEQAIEDLEQFTYLIETAYSGKDYWARQGCDFNVVYTKINAFISDKEIISVFEFENYMYSLLKGKILDSHFSIRGHKNHGFKKQKRIYFADILLNKNQEGRFIVIDSRVESVSIGSVFDVKDRANFVFKTLSPNGSEHFLVGNWSYKKITEMNLNFDGKSINVPFHTTRLKNAKFNEKPLFEVDTIDNIPIVRASTFMNPKENIPLLTEFEEYGKNLKNEEKFILNIYNNDGGSSIHPLHFIENFNSTVNDKEITAFLFSPSISQMYAQFDISDYPEIFEQPGVEEYRKEVLKHQELNEVYKQYPKKEWEFKIDTSDFKAGTYKGTMVVLMNRKTVSSGETAVYYSKSVKNAICVGENTSGAGTFSPAMKYYLPNSKICMQIAHHIGTPSFQESIGFIPDYWLDSNTPIDEIVKWLNNPETYQFTFSNLDN